MQDIVDVDAHLDSIGKIGSIVRLKEIARLDLGKRSEAAKLAIINRENNQLKNNNEEHQINSSEILSLGE